MGSGICWHIKTLILVQLPRRLRIGSFAAGILRARRTQLSARITAGVAHYLSRTLRTICARTTLCLTRLHSLSLPVCCAQRTPSALPHTPLFRFHTQVPRASRALRTRTHYCTLHLAARTAWILAYTTSAATSCTAGSIFARISRRSHCCLPTRRTAAASGICASIAHCLPHTTPHTPPRHTPPVSSIACASGWSVTLTRTPRTLRHTSACSLPPTAPRRIILRTAFWYTSRFTRTLVTRTYYHPLFLRTCTSPHRLSSSHLLPPPHTTHTPRTHIPLATAATNHLRRTRAGWRLRSALGPPRLCGCCPTPPARTGSTRLALRSCRVDELFVLSVADQLSCLLVWPFTAIPFCTASFTRTRTAHAARTLVGGRSPAFCVSWCSGRTTRHAHRAARRHVTSRTTPLSATLLPGIGSRRILHTPALRAFYLRTGAPEDSLCLHTAHLAELASFPLRIYHYRATHHLLRLQYRDFATPTSFASHTHLW